MLLRIRINIERKTRTLFDIFKVLSTERIVNWIYGINIIVQTVPNRFELLNGRMLDVVLYGSCADSKLSFLSLEVRVELCHKIVIETGLHQGIPENVSKSC